MSLKCLTNIYMGGWTGAAVPQRRSRNRGLRSSTWEASAIGTFEWPVRVARAGSERSETIPATVDTGAFYSVVPARLLRDIGVERFARRRMRLADGRVVDADIGEARVTVNGGSVTTLVVFGQDDAPALLGAYTLEGPSSGARPRRATPHPPRPPPVVRHPRAHFVNECAEQMNR